MAWVAKRPANKPLANLFSSPLTAQFYLLLLIGPLGNKPLSYQFLNSEILFNFHFSFEQLNVVEGS